MERALLSRGKTNRIVRRALRHLYKNERKELECLKFSRSGAVGVHATKQRKICSTKCFPCIIFNQRQIFSSSDVMFFFSSTPLFVPFGSRYFIYTHTLCYCDFFRYIKIGSVLFVFQFWYGDQNGLLMEHKRIEYMGSDCTIL